MKNTKIEWSTHTFNPWIGCTEVSEGCRHCYARTIAERFGHAQWGNDQPRHRTSPSNWRQPLGWNRSALKIGQRSRVFSASMADLFDKKIPPKWRADFWKLLKQCDALDWLLLTKRPTNILSMLPRDWETGWHNVWIGTTVENQRRAEERIPILREIPAVVRFLSVEPLLEPLQLDLAGIDWVIVGGESGRGCRPMHPDWVRSIQNQCEKQKVAFFFKQWGGISPKTAGAVLDGREWREFPTPRSWGES